MKLQKLFFTTMFLALTFGVNAQGRTDGQNSMHAEFGFMPSEITNTKFAYMLKGGYGRVFGSKGFLGKADFFYSTYQVGYIDDIQLPYQKFGINIMPGWSFEGLNPVYFNTYLGVFGTFENVNNGNKTTAVNSIIIPENVQNFTFGFLGSIEIEVMMFKSISFVVDFTQYYDILSKFSTANFAIYGGFKYNF